MEAAKNCETLNLYAHQREAIHRALKHDSFALLADMGVGKTLIATELIRLRSVPTLVVCPINIIESAWVETFAKWYPEVEAINLWKVRKKLKADGDWRNLIFSAGQRGKTHVGIINYESMRKLPAAYWDNIKFLIADESSRLKDPNTLTAKFLLGSLTGRSPGRADEIKHRLIMSGTPAPNSPIEYWSQMAVVNKSLLGSHFYQFRAARFTALPPYGFKWIPKKGTAEWIMQQVDKQAFRITKEECLDLPEKVFEVRSFEMAKEQKAHYTSMLKTNLAALENTTVISPTELVKIMKLRQITSGFLLDGQGQPHSFVNTKFELLKEVLEDIGPMRQVIIWCQFHIEIEHLLKNIPGSVGLYGDMSQKAKEEALAAFKEGRAPVLIAHPKTGGVGLTLINCSYNVYYSLDYSYEGFAQSQDRTHRIGQSNSVTYVILLAQGSIDEVIWKALNRKGNVSEGMLAMLKGEVE